MVKFELFNEVGDEEKGITVDGVRTFLNANKSEDITFQISTMGGDLAQAITIFSLIKSHPGKTIAEIIGLTASAGTVIAMACDEVVMSDNALFLVHNGWSSTTGNVYDFQKAASDLMKNDAIMVKMYREKTGLKDDEIKGIMKASDWLSPQEALNYGFIDRIETSGIKIAASVMISEARAAKINEQLLIKLSEKMKNPFIKAKATADVMNVLALKDGNNLLISAEEAATGVEVAPLGAMTLEDGEYELADGRKIVVAGGVITEVVELETPVEEAAAETEEIVAAVGEIVAKEIAAVKAEFKAEFDKIRSIHKPVKGTVPVSASIEVPIQSRVKAVTDGIFNKIHESRNA